MKKIINLLLMLGVITLLFSVTGQRVLADSPSYDITNVKVASHIQADGNLTIERKITYKFDSSARGVYYRQNLLKNQKLLNPQVEIINQGVTKAIINNSSGSNDTYQLSYKNGYQFKVFHKVKAGNRFTIVYRYKITNAIKNWQDTAELNFKIIGNGWETDLDHVEAEVIFPSKVPILKAWAHGDISGHIQVLPDKGRIIMTADNVAGDTGIEVHAIFPTSVTTDNKNVSNEKRKQFILKQEKQLAEEANQRRKRAGYILIFSIIVSILAIIVSLFVKKQGSKPKKMSALAHSYEIPEVSPIIAQILDKTSKPDTQALMALITELTGKHKLEIREEKVGKIIKKSSYRIFLKDQTALSQQPLLRFLFDEVGNGASFSTYELKKFDDPKELSEKYQAWRNQYYKQAYQRNYFSNKIREKKQNIVALAGILVVINAIIIFLSCMLSIISWQLLVLAISLAILNGISWLVAASRLSIYTEKGAEITNQVRSFKKMLENIGNFKMRDIGELILWEEIMPYAVALGLSEKVLKQLRLEFSESELATSDLVVYQTLYLTNSSSNNFEHSFTSAFNAGSSISSDTGSSGGFSSGSSGGFGGGSGGGAF
ncbi:DUF2207 domain-containing protein [Lactobacillus jensenii]|uniref:DUF2207 domain-containing protein n=1 Tax=Lactobacillus jensenii TaxID=109790 RepID=A0A5N1IIM8_LACJE|nr:DUF2207 domain-containing protein [Lactobacillus jensenii]KAA9323767.1 DUF2207 domain-containing protein [Lactobacillus jensenii]